MDFVTLLGARSRGPRLFGMAAALAGVLALVLINWPGGASAALGPTDLALTKGDSPDPVAEGGRLTYTIQVKNQGANDATGVVVTDPLSASEVDFVSATATSGTCEHKANTVTCSLGTLNAGATATVTVLVEPKKTGTLSNTATLASSTQDSTPNNNQATATTVVNQTGQAGKASCASPTITGTTGDDVITGTDRADVIVTLAGNDQVFAGGGKDLVCTDGGADLVSGGPGGDTAIGGADPDTLKGKGGNDVLKGKGGPDRLRGNAGNDLLNGGGSRDSCKGGAGSDTLKRCP